MIVRSACTSAAGRRSEGSRSCSTNPRLTRSSASLRSTARTSLRERRRTRREHPAQRLSLAVPTGYPPIAGRAGGRHPALSDTASGCVYIASCRKMSDSARPHLSVSPRAPTTGIRPVKPAWNRTPCLPRLFRASFFLPGAPLRGQGEAPSPNRTRSINTMSSLVSAMR